jgi:CTP synthase (UTP-ammonia lyase)
MFIMVSYLPVPSKIGEMKTKPTQHAVRTLNAAGIQPNMIIARSSVPLDAARKRKISVFCNVAEKDVISAPDVNSIYEIPVNFEKDKLGQRILTHFALRIRSRDFRKWNALVKKTRDLEKRGLLVPGINPNKNLVEIIELPKHKFFMATQFHPEFKSRPLSPHPIFKGFIAAATEGK